MKIGLDVMSTQMDTRERFGRVALELLGSGISVDQIVHAGHSIREQTNSMLLLPITAAETS